MTATPNYALQEMTEGQANHHLIYNQLVNELESKFGFVISALTTAEPGAPSEGDAYILPTGRTGTVWATFAIGSIALYYSAGWQEFAPNKGWHVMDNGTENLLYYDGSAWVQKTFWEKMTGGYSTALDIKITGDLDIDGAADFSSTININGAVTIPTGSLDVTGTTYLSGTVTMSNASVSMSALPATDPSVAGRLWADSTDNYTIKVSQG